MRSMRIIEHPILGEQKVDKIVHITVDGRTIEAIEGEAIAAALYAAGIKTFRYTEKFHKPRSIFCAIGRCTDCAMIVDGVPCTRTCVTKVREGMVVETQEGCGKCGETE